MAITILSTEIMSEARHPFRTPNPADTVDTIISDLAALENQIDSPQVNAEVTELSTGGILFGRNSRPCLNIKLRDTKTSELKKFGCAILPQEFGNLVYLVKYEYMDMGFFEVNRDEVLKKVKKKLNTLDKWMEYTFIQTLGDFIFVEMLEKYDPKFNGHLDAYRTFFTIE